MPLTADDILAIQHLYARYNHAADFGQPSEWADCFAPDGIYAGPTGDYSGRENLEAICRGVQEGAAGNLRFLDQQSPYRWGGR